MEHIEKVLNQYFPAPECRAVWEKWSNNLKGNIACSLASMALPEALAENYLQKLRAAVSKNDLQEIFRLTAEPEYRTTALLSCGIHTSPNLSLRVWHQGKTFDLLYGTISKTRGHFFCMPDQQFSCYLGEPSELSSNAEKLVCKFDRNTAVALAECVQKAAEIATAKERNANTQVTAEQKDVLQQHWETAMNLSTRARNALNRYGKRISLGLWGGKPEGEPIVTVQDLADLSPTEIYCIRNMGIVTRREIREELERLGVQNTAWYKV